MKLNYKRLGDYIRPVDVRNKDLISTELLGINIDKFFMPSVANIIGTDLRNYKLLSKWQFACNPMHIGRDEKLPIALYLNDTPAIVSPAYFVFEVADNRLLCEYLMLWFRRTEFDRECWFYTDASVRGGITWEAICDMRLPIPTLAEQQKIVDAYNTLERRIELKRKINENLEAQAFSYFINNFDPEKKDKLMPDWKMCKLFELAPVITGKKDANTTCGNGKYPFFSCSQGILFTNDHTFNGNAVLVAGNGDFNIKWYCGEFEAYQRTYVLLPYNSYQYSFLYYVLKYRLPNAINSARGSVISFITKGILENIECFIPNNENEMLTYCKKLNAFNQAIDINKVDIQATMRLQQALLTKLSSY